MLRDHLFKGVLALAVCAAMGGAARADQALVVGVNHYPALDGVDLKGCVNDAQSVAGALRDKYHFDVTLLSDDKAKKQEILDALDHIAANIKPSERFVFYFAGHGTIESNGSSVLLPSDADQDTETNDLGADVLSQKIKTIQASSRTVLLDSCFSGGMMRSAKGIGGHGHLITRGYVRPNRRSARGGSKDLALVNLADTNDSLGGGGNVCYFTATTANEQAGEDEFNGQRHGVFTYYLVPRLDGQRDLWQAIKDSVVSQVADYMDDTQHPTLSPNYDNVVAFDDKAADTPPVTNNQGPTSLWDLYSEDHVDHSKVSLTMSPDQTSLSVNDEISFHVETGEMGYLVVLERGTSGNVNLIYPLDGTVDSASVSGDVTTDFPGDGKAYKADDAGTERIKAILFDDRSQAQELLSNFAGKSRGLARHQMQSRDLELVSATQTPQFFTSAITFEVTQ